MQQAHQGQVAAGASPLGCANRRAAGGQELRIVLIHVNRTTKCPLGLPVLGYRIREARDSRGIKAQGLAARIGCGPGYISNIESGFRQCLFNDLVNIASALGVQLTEISVQFPVPEHSVA